MKEQSKFMSDEKFNMKTVSNGRPGNWISFRVVINIAILAFVFVFFMLFKEANGFESHLRVAGSLKSFKQFSISKQRDLTDIHSAKHAIIVAGHAVVRMKNLNVASTEDIGWYLLPYQQNQGYAGIITSHIEKAISLLVEDNNIQNSLLIFSGGQTRHDVGPISEALSYYLVADQLNWLSDPDVKERTFLEEYAKDSYENLIFSICRFHEVTGHYPSSITVIGFDFKATRFIDIHRAAIGYPIQAFNYIGLKVNNMNFDYAKALTGEEIAVAEFRSDSYGCKNADLVSKKMKRNPFYRMTPYELSCPELKDLLTYCDSNKINFDSLPWNTNTEVKL